MTVRERITQGLLAAWALAACIVVAFLMVNHVVAMPSPRDASSTAAALASLREGDAPTLVAHVIYERCSCTRRLITHLLDRRAAPGREEWVLYVGSGGRRAEIEAAGYRFHPLDAESLARRYGVEAAPVLVALEGGELRYAGGYFDHPAAVDSRDGRLLAKVAAGGAVEALPVYGCAVAPALRRAVDPLGLRE